MECGLCYTRPLPTEDELATLYDHNYIVYQKDNAGCTKRPLLSIGFLIYLFKQSVNWDRHRALLGSPPGRVLDVGCGNGDFLISLKRRGWGVYGTEFSATGCYLASAKGIAMHQGAVADARFPDNFFDVVTAWHVLEHQPDPTAELPELRRVLRDNGLLVIEVPNSDCPTFRLCGERWIQLDVPRHLQHFAPATLGRLLSEGGFAPVRRRDFHLWDFTYTWYSVMDSLGVLRRLRMRYFSTDFRPAPLGSKALFLALGVPLALLCLVYSAVTAALGAGETLTITARKAAI